MTTSRRVTKTPFILLPLLIIQKKCTCANSTPPRQHRRSYPECESSATDNLERILAALEQSDDRTDESYLLLDEDDSYFDTSYESYLEGLYAYTASGDTKGAELSAQQGEHRVVGKDQTDVLKLKKDQQRRKPNGGDQKSQAKAPGKQSPPKRKPGSETRSAFMSITTPWIRNFLASCSKDILLPVPKDFFADNFNLSQLPSAIERYAEKVCTGDNIPKKKGEKSFSVYRQALQLIMNDDPPLDQVPEKVELAARALYYLVHQRYIVSPRGLDTVRRRFLLRKSSVDPIFGRCPKLSCGGCPLLPIGQSCDISVNESVDSKARRYCFACNDVFHHWDSKIDGCAWGDSFCFLFLMIHGKTVFGESSETRRSEHINGVNSIFGFQIHPSAGLPESWNK